MNVRFLFGRANTGKSRALYAALAAHQRAGERAVLIVPEQYTFEAERALSAALGGLLGVQVLSFARLNERVLALHGQLHPFLSQQGHRMVIRRAALRQADALGAFARAAGQPGFAADMQTIFSDLKRAGLTPKTLDLFVQKLPEQTALREKLADIALLYADTEAFLADRYLTIDDAANAARALLPDSFIRGAHVYIDGIDRPSRQLYQWLGGLIAAAADVTIALRCDTSSPRDADLFLPDLRIYSQVRDMAARVGATVSVTHPGRHPGPCAEELAYLEANLFALRSLPYEKLAPAITVFGASDRVAEVESLADAILSRARMGVRYREMAVIVSDPESYMPLVTRVFARRGIPVFLDRKHPVTGHAAVDAVLAAGRAAEGRFSPTEVLRLVKSGYVDVSQDDVEALELYLLRTGLKGGALAKPFTRGEVPAGAERARMAVMEPLLRLRKALAPRPVSVKVRALYAYLVEIGLDNALKSRVQSLLAAGRVALMEEHAQVWNALMEALSQLDAIMGDVPVSRKLFWELLEEGLSSREIGVIPGTSDQVLLGDVARTKSRAVRALFLVGVNDGLLPAARNDDGVIDDRELKALERAGMPVWSDTRQRAADDRLELYTALSKARETLFVSYSFCADGSELAPSSLIADILRLFPRCNTKTDLEASDALPQSERAGLRLLTRDLCALHSDNTLSPRLPTLLAYYGALPAYAARVRRMAEAGQPRFSLPPLGRALSGALYGTRIRMSASRLEQFAACPFKHFVRYGLAAADRCEFAERAADLGTFYHAALEAFIRTAVRDGRTLQAMDDAEIDARMDALLPQVISEHNDGIFLYNDRLRATLFLLVESVKMSARAVVRQIQAGRFTPAGAEVRFGEGQAFPPIRLTLEDGTEALLSGVIDRVDAADVPGAPLRVVDYKLGEREFDFSGILNGLTLQLPLYLAAVSQDGRLPAGMYYMPLRVPPISEGEDAERAVEAAFMLRGLTLSSASLVLLSDRACKSGDSAVLKGVRRAEEGVFSGSVCTRAQMERILQLAREVSQRTLAAMLDGHIEVHPAEGSCKYCDYRSICRFDPMVRGCRTRKFNPIGRDAFFALIGGVDDALDN